MRLQEREAQAENARAPLPAVDQRAALRAIEGKLSADRQPIGMLSSGLDRELGLVLLAIVLGKMGLEALALRAIRGSSIAMRHLVFAPLKDLLMFGVWVYAMFSRSIEWRGIRVRIGPDSQLLPDEGALPVRVIRRLLSA